MSQSALEHYTQSIKPTEFTSPFHGETNLYDFVVRPTFVRLSSLVQKNYSQQKLAKPN